MNNPNNIVYALALDVKHGDLYYMQEDGTIILGIYDDRKLAEQRLVAEYESDKTDLLDGSCAPDGNYEITEDNPMTVIEDDEYVAYGAKASLVVSEKADGSFDREYTYSITPHTLNK